MRLRTRISRHPAARLLLLFGATGLATGCATSARRDVIEVTDPEAVARQLATFDHAWRRIRETHPYEDMRGIDWEGIRDELRPRAAGARSAAELRPILQDMVGRLGESHYQVMSAQGGEVVAALESIGDDPAGGAGEGDDPPRGGDGEVGLDLRIRDGQAIVTRVLPDGPAARAGVRPGFVLRRVGTREVEPLLASILADAGPDASFLAARALLAGLSGPAGSTTPLTFLGEGGSLVELAVDREEPRGEIVRYGLLPDVRVRFASEMLPGTRIGYVRFNMFLPQVAAPFADAVEGFVDADAEGVIVDLRGNPGGVAAMVMGLSGHFIARQGVSLGTMKTRQAELRFMANPRADAQRYDGPLAILVDELSASTSELFAAGMQAQGRARVFGTTSAGMALPSVIESLPNGDRLQFVTADLLAPDGARIEGVGVVPDQVVPISRDALLSDDDPVVAAAVAWIQGTPSHEEGRRHAGPTRSSATRMTP